MKKVVYTTLENMELRVCDIKCQHDVCGPKMIIKKLSGFLYSNLIILLSVFRSRNFIDTSAN